jgi:hypothetical protein
VHQKPNSKREREKDDKAKLLSYESIQKRVAAQRQHANDDQLRSHQL